jgi:hypothetical protein
MKDEGGYGGVQHPHIEQLINYNSKYTEKR